MPSRLAKQTFLHQPLIVVFDRHFHGLDSVSELTDGLLAREARASRARCFRDLGGHVRLLARDGRNHDREPAECLDDKRRRFLGRFCDPGDVRDLADQIDQLDIVARQDVALSVSTFRDGGDMRSDDVVHVRNGRSSR